MKIRTLVIAIAIALLGVVVAMAVSILHDGLSARATPSRFEIMLARNARHLAIPSNARVHFADHCTICHGNDGSGQTMIGGGLYPKPPDLRQPETQNLTDGELFWIIENGVRFTGMPAFSTGGEHGGMQGSWKLVHFIRHLPRLTAAERIEMERYNPKGLDERAEEQQENDFLNGATPQRKTESQDHR